MKAILVFLFVGVLIWSSWATLPGSQLQTSTLKTSFNRLSSTEVFLSIPEPGKLIIEAGPSGFLGDASLFAMAISSERATPTESSPYILGSTFTTVFNFPNPSNSKEFILATIFPRGHFSGTKNTIAELPFTVSGEGQFEIQSIYFGSLPRADFPPFQDYPIYIESSNILFDENGMGREVTTGGTQPPPTQTPACADTDDNDGDGLIDYPDDPGCEDLADNDEEDPTPEQLRLDIATQFIERIKTPELKTELLVVLPPAQEQLRYEFQMEASGGAGNISFAVRGITPDINSAFPLGTSGLRLKTDGRIIGEGPDLKAGNYRLPLLITDGSQFLNFSLQIAVHDVFGNPTGLILESNISGTQQECLVGESCEAFFRATAGIQPYTYSFSGETPTEGSFLQVNAGEAFYRFIPTIEQVGTYQITIAAFDSDVRIAGGDEEATRNTSSINFTLSIVAPEVESSFKFSAGGDDCNFLDISTVDPLFDTFQFTCEQGIMQGYQGLVRPFDTLNRAEASKITSLIFAESEEVDEAFEPFVLLPPFTPVNFNDVTVGDWYATYVFYLFTEGIIIDNILYRPGDTLNAAEAMKLVVESYASLSEEILNELEEVSDYGDWFAPYQTISSYVDADIAYVDPASPAVRGMIADLLYKLAKAYPVRKFL